MEAEEKRSGKAQPLFMFTSRRKSKLHRTVPDGKTDMHC